jgi:hypothetical protein
VLCCLYLGGEGDQSTLEGKPDVAIRGDDDGDAHEGFRESP